MGRFGNQLCPYFLGRIISDHLNFKLFGPTSSDREYSLKEINVVYDQPGYASYQNPVQLLGNDSLGDQFSHPDFNLNSLLNDKTPRKIILDGYFQRKKFFVPYRDQIKQWFDPIKYNVPKDQVAVHVRLGDCLQPNLRIVLNPLQYYIEALNSLKFTKVVICTDSPNDKEYIEPLVKKYDATLFAGTEKQTISFLAAHNNLILSQGTFSFWASFLCDGENIVNEIQKTGYNSLQMRDKIDLLLDGPNYKYIKL
jgi:hypothetical protein